jgi:hypothetical protein
MRQAFLNQLDGLCLLLLMCPSISTVEVWYDKAKRRGALLLFLSFTYYFSCIQKAPDALIDYVWVGVLLAY